jgi:hypothetical protein
MVFWQPKLLVGGTRRCGKGCKIVAYYLGQDQWVGVVRWLRRALVAQ